MGSVSTIADIGGGIGTQLIDILDRFPASKGILFDREDVLSAALHHPNISYVSGDFFKEMPSGADAYLVRTILHDWPDREASAILASIRSVMTSESRLFLTEMIVPEEPEMVLAKWSDLLIAVVTGGRERTATDFKTLLISAGFELQHIVRTPSPLGVVIGKPV